MDYRLRAFERRHLRDHGLVNTAPAWTAGLADGAFHLKRLERTLQARRRKTMSAGQYRQELQKMADYFRTIALASADLVDQIEREAMQLEPCDVK